MQEQVGLLMKHIMAFAVKINNKVKQSGNEIVQYFDKDHASL